jgi:hypothetical protein
MQFDHALRNLWVSISHPEWSISKLAEDRYVVRHNSTVLYDGARLKDCAEYIKGVLEPPNGNLTK